MTTDPKVPVLGRVGPPPEMPDAVTSVAASLDVHDARHAYLDIDDPEVEACLWCQS